MVSATVADSAGKGASAGSHAMADSGMLPPVQALTRGFVHDTLPLPVPDTPLSLTATAGAFAAASPAASAGAGATTEAMPAPSVASMAASSPGMTQPAAQAAGKMAGFVTAMPMPAVSADFALAAGDTQSRQGVRIGDAGIMLAYEDSSELTEVPDLYYLPNAPAWVKGLANLHGNLVPVFDVAQYLDVQKTGDQAMPGLGGGSKPMLLVLGHGAGAAGVVIDGIPQRLIPTEKQKTDTDTAPALLLPHIRGAYFINEQLWFDLDCSSLLNMLEQAMMHHA